MGWRDSDIIYWINYKGLDSPKAPRRFCVLFFEVLPFATLAVSVNGETSKRGVRGWRGDVWCVWALIPKTL